MRNKWNINKTKKLSSINKKINIIKYNNNKKKIFQENMVKNWNQWKISIKYIFKLF